MKFTRECNANGTCLQGYLGADYTDLVACFGEPDGNYDDYKSDANWDITFADGTVACIYNWKNGMNYCGQDGTDVLYITEWNVGGQNKDAVYRVKEALAEYHQRVSA